MLIFVTGGVRSGKSACAEKLAVERSNARRIHYAATSRQTDPEMRERIRRHQEKRGASPVEWVTWEVERKICLLHEKIEQEQVILLDCLTTLLNNELFQWKDAKCEILNIAERRQLFYALLNGIERLQQNRILIVVSNEIFHGILNDSYASTFVYAAMLGKLHQRLVKQADEAYLCENGIPIRLK